MIKTPAKSRGIQSAKEQGVSENTAKCKEAGYLIRFRFDSICFMFMNHSIVFLSLMILFIALRIISRVILTLFLIEQGSAPGGMAHHLSTSAHCLTTVNDGALKRADTESNPYRLFCQ
jgi:Na+-transporting methylmalonyl-CoA/oxaloacetate decarboxylase gamma subunit